MQKDYWDPSSIPKEFEFDPEKWKLKWTEMLWNVPGINQKSFGDGSKAVIQI